MIKILSTSDDFKFKHRFSYLVSGPSGSGMYSFCIRFLQNLNALRTDRNIEDGMIWYYSEETAVPNQQFVLLKKKIRYNELVPLDFENVQGRPCLIILDALLNDVYCKELCDFPTKGSHHGIISVIVITPILVHQGRYCRAFSLIAKYYVLLKSQG